MRAALDEGHIRAGLYSTPLAEVELELKSGSISDLFKFRFEHFRLENYVADASIRAPIAV